MEESLKVVSVRFVLDMPDNTTVDVNAFKKDKFFRTEFTSYSKDQVLCRSVNSWFACARNTDDSKWSLAISSATEDEMPGSFIECEKLLSPHCTVFGVSLRDLVDSKDFQLVSCEEVVNEQGAKLLRIEFDSTPVLKVGTKRTIVIVDPQNGGRIVSANLGRTDGKEFSLKTEYSAGSDFPSTVTMMFDGDLYRKVRYFDWSLKDIPTEPFHMDYYGFGEKRRSSYATYLLMLAILILR